MARGRKPRTWVRLDCQGILTGSINYLLPLEGQAVWIKMIAYSELCGGRPGFIEDNNENGLPHDYIAQELHCPIEVFTLVLAEMGNDGAIKIHGSGSIELVNFQHYQFSEYDRQKPYREAKKNKPNLICPQCHWSTGPVAITSRWYTEICRQCGTELREVDKEKR